jgi:uncharacterized protein (DUF488 family)
LEAIPQPEPPAIFTIGHSNHTLEKFLSLLKLHQIEVLVDVRSRPYSRYAPHFNKKLLSAELPKHSIKYLFLGDKLGGRPENKEYYDEEGLVLHDRLAVSNNFAEGLKLVMDQLTTCRMALMCSEEDPAKCHRSLLIGRVLQDRGVTVLHIRGHGGAQREPGA